MTEKMSEMPFEEAVTEDWKNAYATDIQKMSPVQKFALRKAWAEVESMASASENDFDRKVSRMGSSEFNRLTADVLYDADRAKANK